MARHPICFFSMERTKERINTASKEKPFYSTVSDVVKVRIFGLLVVKLIDKGSFPV